MESIGKDAYTRTIVDRRHFHGLPDNHLESNGESEIYWIKNSEFLNTWDKGDYPLIINDSWRMKDAQNMVTKIMKNRLNYIDVWNSGKRKFCQRTCFLMRKSACFKTKINSTAPKLQIKID